MVSGLFSGSGAEPKLHRSSTPESRKHSEVEDGTNRIKVICRVRPLTADENAFQEMTSAGNNTVAVLGRESPQNFTFDKVFDVSASQSDIYDYSIKDTVNDVLNGYNGTILAYGQTGAGKSYTMLGPSISGDLEKGLIPRISDEIFHQIKTNGSNDIEYTVSLSIMEIYLEQINDFLVADNVKLSIHEDRDHGIYVKGLSHAFISNTEELYKLLQLGIKHRASHVTNMNMESSRSHAIFQIKIDQKNLKDESIKKSNLFLIDLAGSEKVDKTGAVGQTLKEAQNINSSLSALGNVINALTDHKSTHIPYRDSKLTRILQESLGGNSRTTLILNVSPSSVNELETISTLRFGSRAKHIKNRAYINKELSPAELKFRLSQLQRENEQNKLYIEKLENQLKNGGRAFTGPVTPSKDFESRIPTLTKSPKSPNLNAEKDQKIKQLEDEILSYKINNLKISNEE
ncbi:kinesin-domain-containing protein, partial [Yamadazyma tenuis ATCC 10573]